MTGPTAPIPAPTRPPGRPLWHAALITLAGVGVGALAVAEPLYAGVLGVLLLFVALVTRAWAHLHRSALGLIGISLAGYAFLGKGYAYVGVPPLFIGEVTLLLGALAAVRAVQTGTRLRHVTGLLVLLGVFIVLGVGATVPHIPRYQLDSLRDAATWYYALFAVIVALLIVRLDALRLAINRYGRIVPYFLLFAPVGLWVSRLLSKSLPVWPISGQTVLDVKGGDLAVHLAGIMVYLLLGLQRIRANPEDRAVASGHARWWWWFMWLLAAMSLLTGRAALVSIMVPLALVMVLRPLSRWGRPLFVLTTILSLVLIINPRYEASNGRELSIDGLLLNVQSIAGGTGESTVDGTRTWRLDWWKKIENYTVNGDYFWTGKGYGVNLANTDGFQVEQDQSLRNPHSIHFAILARSGVPGLVSWIALNVAFAGSLLLAFVRARSAGQTMWANVHLWALAYWLAFVVNASFDVYLEGPQGGIWFWSAMGFGIAALELYRRGEEL